MQSIQSISVSAYASLEADKRPTLIDVREPWEFKIAHIGGAQLLPLGQIGQWAQTLDKNAAYVVMCHHGGRSMMACQVLAQAGIKNVANLDGGIAAWSTSVDPSIPQY